MPAKIRIFYNTFYRTNKTWSKYTDDFFFVFFFYICHEKSQQFGSFKTHIYRHKHMSAPVWMSNIHSQILHCRMYKNDVREVGRMDEKASSVCHHYPLHMHIIPFVRYSHCRRRHTTTRCISGLTIVICIMNKTCKFCISIASLLCRLTTISTNIMNT